MNLTDNKDCCPLNSDNHEDGTPMEYGRDYNECLSNESFLEDLAERMTQDSLVIVDATNHIVNYLLKDEVKNYFECQSIEEQRGHILNALINLIGKTTTNIQTHAYDELQWHWDKFRVVDWDDLQENHFKLLDMRIDNIKAKAYPKKSEVLQKVLTKLDIGSDV
ncbi:hypothetical protein [uncultured Mediterranean phage uvMED]|nr:hypothetical protein [uncultured Mediterranean phage uvMED]